MRRHSAARNFSEATRKVIFFGYSYRWLRGLDYRCCPCAILTSSRAGFRPSRASFAPLELKLLLTKGRVRSLMPDWLLSQCDPIQRQLLGDIANAKGHWQPTQEDVPLKTFIETHRGVGLHAVKSSMIFPSTPGSQQGDVESTLTGKGYRPVLGEWAKL